MSQEKLQTMSIQNFWGLKEVYYGIVQVVNCYFKMVAPSALVFRPLVKGSEALGTRLGCHAEWSFLARVQTTSSVTFGQ